MKSIISFGQDQLKVDSVFKFYFFIFDMETTTCCPREKYPEYYDTILIPNSKDTAYLNKYVQQAAIFLQRISKIKSEPSNYEGNAPIVHTVNPGIVKKWKEWYINNRDKIKWNRRKNKPVI